MNVVRCQPVTCKIINEGKLNQEFVSTTTKTKTN